MSSRQSDAGHIKAVVTGGGTAGHAYPAVAVARELIARGAEVVYAGVPGGPEDGLCREAGIRFEPVASAGLQRSASLRNAAALLRVARGFVRALGVLARHEPDVVLGTGGYVSVPVAAAAWVHRIPLVIHEQNSVPGLANRLASRFAAAIAVSFPGTEKSFSRSGGGPIVVHTGNPVRADIAAFDRAALRKQARAEFRLKASRRTILIFGGSQGARSINEAALGAYNRWRDAAALQVLHLTGRAAHVEMERRLAELQGEEDSVIWRLVEYTERMDLAYALADLAVCRAGAGTMVELAAAGVPAILVPYPHATADHQMLNAKAARALGGAEIFEDSELDPESLTRRVEELIFDQERLARMAEGIRKLAAPDASAAVAALVYAAARRSGPGGSAPQGT